MIDISYQNIFDIVRPSLPENWTRIVFFFAFMPDTCEIMYFVQLNSMEYVDCFHLDQDREELVSKLSRLYKEVQYGMKEITAEKIYSVITVVIDADGNMHADFDYTDITENFDSYYKSWMNQYIN